MEKEGSRKSSKSPITKMQAIVFIAIVAVAAVASGLVVYQMTRPSGTTLALGKVAVVCQNSRDDGDWGTLGYHAVLWMREKYPGVQVDYSDTVPYADFEKVIREYAEEGYDMIFCNGGQFSDAIMAVAPDYPNVQFVYTCEPRVKSNVAVMYYHEEQYGYLFGMVAGMMTESNTVGVVLGMTGSCSNSFAWSFKAGAESVNPAVRVLYAYVGSYVDVVTAKNLATSMINEGADFIAPYLGIAWQGVAEACKNHGVFLPKRSSDGTALSLAPDNIVVGVLSNHTIGLKIALDNRLAGKPPMAEIWQANMQNNYIYSDKFYLNVSQDIQNAFWNTSNNIKNGIFEVPRIETVANW